MIWRSRAFSTSRASTIALSASGLSGSWPAVIAMDQTRPYSPPARDRGIRAESLRRGSAGLSRNAGPAHLVDAPPVETFEQRRQLRGRQPHHAVMHLRPAELA